jgi:hypothetical protein
VLWLPSFVFMSHARLTGVLIWSDILDQFPSMYSTYEIVASIDAVSGWILVQTRLSDLDD